MEGALRFEARGTFRVTPEALWPLVADTARMNRVIGNPPGEYTVTPLEGGGSRLEVQMRLFGLPLARYTEHPFRWEAPRGFVVVREFQSGPLWRVRAGTELSPTDGGTEVAIYGEFVPRNALGAALVKWLVGPRSVSRALKQCRLFERYLLGEADDPFPQLAKKKGLPAGARGAAEQLVRGGLSREAVELLRRHLAEAADEDVVKMRPFELADRWGLDRRETLALFLRATADGLLVMTWDVLCPNCRIGKAEHASLRDLAAEAHCETCNIRFDASFDRSIEVRFSVAPALRRVENREFCMGGPMNTPHIVAQASVAAGGAERLGLALEAGTYRLRARPGRGRALVEAISADGGRGDPAPTVPGPPLAVTITREAIEPAMAELGAGPVSLEVVNRSDLEQVVVLEGDSWPDTIATAAYVSSMQEFRELFSWETLAPGLEFGIERLAFMFAELPGSGALEQGDGAGRDGRSADEHSEALKRAISANRGALVRMSDSGEGALRLMAAFRSGAEALAAALQIQREAESAGVPPANRGRDARAPETPALPGEEGALVSGGLGGHPPGTGGTPAPPGEERAGSAKIGLHEGPCVTTTVNERLDYVGATVETAAGLERECEGGQILASLAVCRSEAAAGLLAASGARLEEEVLRRPEMAEPVAVYRIRPAGGDGWVPGEVDQLGLHNGGSSPAPVGLLETHVSQRGTGPALTPALSQGERGKGLSDELVHTAGPLVFECRAGSYAEERLEAIAAGYGAAIERITSFLGRAGAALAPITIRLLDVPPADGATAGVDGPAGLEAGVQVTPESPGPAPEVVLTPLVLRALFGAGHREARFWEDGLAGFLAAQGGSAEHTEAAGRVQKLREEGQLQPLADEVQQRAERRSSVAALMATAFTHHLVQWRGPERFCRLLRAARAGRADAFRRVYGRPLQAVEAEWLRKLEASEKVAGASVLGALRDLRPYFLTYRVQLFWILITVLIGLSFDLFTPLALRFLIDNILGRRPLGFALPGIAPAGGQIGPEQQIPALLMLLGVMVFMFLANALTRVRQTYLLATVSEGVNLDLRRRFFEHLQRLPVSFHARTSATDLSQRFFTDIGMVPPVLSTGLALISSGLSMVLFGSTLLSLDLWLGLIAIAGLPVFAMASRQGRAAMREANRERGRRASEIQQSLFENLGGQRFLRLRNASGYALRRFDERLEIHRDLNVRTMILGQALARATALITNAAQVAVLIGGGLIVITSAGRDLSPGGLMAFYVLLLRLYVPAASFAGSLQTLEQAADALARVRKVLDLPPEAEPPDAIELGPLRQALVFQEVELIQPNGKAQLKGLTAEVPGGSRVAFVGPTGSGKPSLLSLLARLEEPTGGAIRWDGADIGGATRESLRSQLSVLMQDTFVLRTTIYDNLRLGKPGAGEAEVLAAARTAGLDDFVAALPNGYDTMVSDRDPLLSTPIRQRLGVAQALLADASVVVMDDATAALEMGEQRELEAALRGPDGSRTLIRVAQRPSTIADADRIYVLDEGLVVESGRHDELVERRGLYAQLLRDEMGEAAVSGARQAVRRVSKLAPFADLPPEVLDEMAKLLLFMEREAGQEIVRQGSVGDELFIVGRGEVEVVVADEEGNERVVNVLGEGDYFGEISFLRRTPRTATVRARTPTELHILRRLDFDHLLEHLGEGMLSHIEATAKARIADTQAKLAALSG